MMFYRKKLADQGGFALVTAIMMLFAATVMGMMVMNSSEVEIILSGAQQRYEDNFNVADGGMSFEALLLGKFSEISFVTSDDVTITRSYSVPKISVYNQPLSPVSGENAYDPGDDISVSKPFDSDDIDSWPMFNILGSVKKQDNRFDYRYKVIYLGPGTPPKGFYAEGGTNYLFQIAANRLITIESGGSIFTPFK